MASVITDDEDEKEEEELKVMIAASLDDATVLANKFANICSGDEFGVIVLAAGLLLSDVVSKTTPQHGLSYEETIDMLHDLLKFIRTEPKRLDA